MRRPAIVGVLVAVAILLATGAFVARSPSVQDAVVGDRPAATPPRLGTRAASRPTNPRARIAQRDAGADPKSTAGSADGGATWTLHGRVLDDAGAVVALANVTLHPLRPPTGGPDEVEPAVASTQSSNEGLFELTIESGEWLVVATKDGFLPQATLVSDRSEMAFALHRGTRCEFTVADDAGKPVQGAVLRQLTYIGDHSLVSGRAISDEVGRAQLAVVGAREEVLVEAAGFAREWVSTREERSGPDPIRVVLREGRAVAGTVVDSEGHPLRGVHVTLDGQRVLTTDDGRFAFDGLEARVQDFVDDGLWLKAHLAGWCGGEHVNVWPGDLDVRVVLRRTATVRGVVVHTDGKPAVGARVNSDFTTDEAGRFELVEFPSGHEFIWAQSRSPEDARVGVEGSVYVDAPPDGTVEGVRIVLEPDTSECFVLVRTMGADGKPIARSEVLAFDGDHRVADNRAGDDGTILLRVRDRDGARVRIAASTSQSPWLDAVAEKLVEARSAPPFETVELRLGPPGRLRLRAVDPAGNDVPIDGVHVSAGRSDVRGTDGTWDLPATRTFSATVLVPGFAVRTVELAPPHQRFREEVIRLVPATHVVGRVVGRDGEPDARDLTIVIAVRDAATGVWERATAQVAKDGRVEFATLPTGPAHVWVLAGDDAILAFSAVEVVAGRTTDLGDLVLAGPTPFRGLVVDETGRGIGGALAIFEDAAGDSVCPPICTRPDGTFDVTLPGRFPMRLRVTRPGRATACVALGPELAPTSPASPFRVVLGQPGRVCVHTEFGRAPGFWSIEMRVPGTTWTWRAPDLDDDDGHDDGDVYGDLPPGPIEVVVTSGGVEHVKTVVVVPGKTVECVLER